MSRTIMMLVLSIIVAASIATPVSADITYVDHRDLDQTLCALVGVFYHHSNPAKVPGGPYTPPQYEYLADNGWVTDVTLELDVSLLDGCESIDVWVDPHGNMDYTYVGTIAANGSTPFDLISAFGPGGLLKTGLKVSVMLEGCEGVDEALLNWSEVRVTIGSGAPIPAPAAVVLGMIGLGLVGWIKSRYA